MMRQKKKIDEILSLTNSILLKDEFGFSKSDIKIANNIWKKALNMFPDFERSDEVKDIIN